MCTGYQMMGVSYVDVLWIFIYSGYSCHNNSIGVLSGLTLLLPYLLTRKKRWARCKVRVFVGGDVQQIEEQKQEYAYTVILFVIDYTY